MGFNTFDNNFGDDRSEFDALFHRSLPDVVEAGETNDVWIYVMRQARQIELVSKITGQAVARFPVTDGLTAAKHGLTVRQLAAAQDALKL